MKYQKIPKIRLRKLGIKEIEENEILNKEFILIEKNEKHYALRIHYKPQNVDEYWIYFMTKKYGALEGSELKLDLKLRDEIRFSYTSDFAMHLFQNFSLNSPRKITSTLEFLQFSYFRDMEINGIKTYEILKEVIWLKTEKEILKTQSELSKWKKKKFIYIIRNNRDGLYKTGYSINPFVREKTLQSEDPELEMITFFEASQSVETEIHRKLKSKRVRGEYFNLSLEELKEAEKFILNRAF